MFNLLHLASYIQGVFNEGFCWYLISVTIDISGLPVTIRLLDPPLHEFLPEGNVEDIVRELSSETGTPEEEVFARIEKLSEVNPMLGFRGCRLIESLFFGFFFPFFFLKFNFNFELKSYRYILYFIIYSIRMIVSIQIEFLRKCCHSI